MKLRRSSPDDAIAEIKDDCVYEVIWSADSEAAEGHILGGGAVTDPETAAAFCLQPSEAGRSISAALSVLQHSNSADARAVAITESTATGAGLGVYDSSACAALLRCAARELPGVAASSASQPSSTFGSGNGRALIRLASVPNGPNDGDVYGSSWREGSVWRPQLMRSTACNLTGDIQSRDQCTITIPRPKAEMWRDWSLMRWRSACHGNVCILAHCAPAS